MNSAQLFFDIEARLRSDTGVHGLFPASAAGALPIAPMVTDIFNNYFNPGQTTPFLVWDLISAPHDDMFEGDMTDVDFQISLYASRTPAQLERSQAILDRVYGDAIRQSNRSPTYGLHRWVPGNTAWPTRDPENVWKYTGCVRRSTVQAHTEDYYHFIEQYNVRMWKDYASTQPV